MTFPRNMGQIPIYYNHFSTGRPLTGTDPQRFVSKYTALPVWIRIKLCRVLLF